MDDKPPDKKKTPLTSGKGSLGGCKEKTYSVSRSHRLNVSPPRIRVTDDPNCECILCERRRERDERNRLRLRSAEPVSTSTHSLVQRCDHVTRQDLRRSLLTSVHRDPGELSPGTEKCQSCPDLIRVSQANTVNGGGMVPGDGMEGYFDANRHLLDDLETSNNPANPEPDTGQKRVAAIPVETHTYHFPPEVMNRANNAAANCDNEDIDEGGVFVCDDDKLVLNCAAPPPQTQPEGSSSDDQGDFIEADIPKNAYKGGLYALSSENNTPSSTDSSYEDLRTMSIDRNRGEGENRRSHHEDDHSYEDLRLLDIKPPPHRQRQQQASKGGMNALSSDNSISSTENALSVSNVQGGCRPKTLHRDSLQIDGAAAAAGAESSPVTSMSESSHRTPSSSFLSPQLSDSGATYGIASESSVFMSPDNEIFEPLTGANHSRPPLLRHRSVDCNEHECPSDGPPFRAVRSSNDIQSADDFGARGTYSRNAASGSMDIQNMDSSGMSYKAHHVKGKNINWKACNSEDGTLKSSCACGGSKPGDARDRSASDASSKKSGRWTYKIVHTGNTYNPNPERYTKPMVCNSVYEAWAETRVRNLFYNETQDLKDALGSSSSSDEDLLANINNLNRRRTDSSDYEDLFNVSRQTSTSNFDMDENSFQHGDTLKGDTLKATSGASTSADGTLRLESRNLSLDSAAGSDHQSEQQENQNNMNLETGERYQQQAQQAAAAAATSTSIDPSESTSRTDPDQLKKTYNDMKLTLRKRKMYKKRTRTVYVKGKPTRHKLIKFKMRPGQIFQALDYDYIHFNYSDSEESASSSDSDTEDGYVDFQVLLRNYMIQRLHERHSLSLMQHQEEVRLAREMEKVMIWSEYEAYMTHIRQIGASACGPTALINVMKALELKIEQEKVCEQVRSNVRNETGSLTEYILSRAVAGMTARQLVESMERLTKGAVSARFFHMYPPRETGSLRKWLAQWMKKGAIPILTLNRQRAVPVGYAMPDAWHHQMVFGAGPKGVYLTNPQEIVPEHVIAEQLCSEGILKVRRKDIVCRWPDTAGGDLSMLLQQKDPRWPSLNVLGQIVHVLREEFGGACRPQLTSHVTIPAWYKSGVTLFAKSNTDVYKELMAAEDFPLKSATPPAAEANETPPPPPPPPPKT